MNVKDVNECMRESVCLVNFAYICIVHFAQLPKLKFKHNKS